MVDLKYMTKKKTKKSKYNQTSAIVSSLKRTFSRSPVVQEVLKEHRQEHPQYNKDGSLAKKPAVRYPCVECKDIHMGKNIQVDHIEPVIPLNIPAKHISLDIIIDRLFCDKNNLQILCKDCHKVKSKEENKIRDEWKSDTKEKHIVYKTTNNINGKVYIGVHSTFNYDDGYLGSGIILKEAIKKYGKTNFYRKILFVYDSKIDAFEKEKELVDIDFIDRDDTYNLSIGGLGGNSSYNNSIKIICHQTQEEFESIVSLSNWLGVTKLTVSNHLNRPDKPLKNLHFFKKDTYDPNVKVSYDCYRTGGNIVHLNTRITYSSLLEAADKMNISYGSLRNALEEKNENGVYQLYNDYFLYKNEFNENTIYYKTRSVIRCIELNKNFTDTKEAAFFLKRSNINNTAIAINRAIRENIKMYKYTWKRLSITEPI